jgi:hypothetical protein
LKSRIGYFITDNASNNDTAVDIVVSHYFPHMPYKARQGRRLRCLGHVINLSARAFLYGKEFDAFEKGIEHAQECSDLLKELTTWRKRGPVGKLHNIIVFICRSPQRRDKFAKIKAFDSDEKGDFDHLNLIIDNATRWNSLYAMIERALKLRDRIDRFCIDNAEAMHGPTSTKKAQTDNEKARLLKNDTLTADDWLALTEIMAILKPFYDLTKRGEGTKLSSDRGILCDYLTSLNDLVKHIREQRDLLNIRADDPEYSTPSVLHLRACIVNCWTKLDEYFSLVNDTPAHYASVITNPKMKWKYFEHTWEKVHEWKDATNPESWLPSGKQALEYLWDEYKYLPLEGDFEPEGRRERAHSPDEYERARDMTLLYENVEEDELEVWLKARPFRLEVGETLPKYWLKQLKQKSTYRLARMGLDMASIPAMSSECERVFSQAKLMITGQRNRLKSDIIEATQCLRMWLIVDRKREGKWKGKGNWVTPEEIYIFDDGSEDGGSE